MKANTREGLFALLHRLLVRLFGPIERGKDRV